MKLLALNIAFFSACLVASPAAYAQSGTFPGDYDGDGIITLTDFATLHGCFAGPEAGPVSPECAVGDFDVDTDLDLKDIWHLQAQFSLHECIEELFDIAAIPQGNPDSIVIVDLNNDEIEDLVTSSWGSPPELRVALGQGDGQFFPFETRATGDLLYLRLKADDFDNDGNADIAVAGIPNLYHVSVFFGDGMGGLTASPAIFTWCVIASRAFTVSSGDFDGNGFRDLLIATVEGLSCILNSGNRTFSEPSCLTNYTAFAAQAGDFDNDGLSDVAMHVASGLKILISNGDGTFQDNGTLPIANGLHRPEVGDLDGDGNNDLIVANPTAERITVLRGHGDGTFEHLDDYVIDEKPYTVVLGDLNHDYIEDAIASTYGSVVVFLGTGDGTLLEDYEFGQGFANNPVPGIATGDLNGDGNLDLGITSISRDVVTIVPGIGDGRFEVPLEYRSSGSGDRVIADFDSDGDQDVAVLGYGHIQVHSNVDTGALIEAADYVTETRDGGRMAIADINRDGDLDLLAVSYVWHYLNVLLGKDGVTFDEPSIYYVGSYVSSMAVTDYNNDSFIDVVLTNYAGILLLPGQMDGTFPSSVLIETEGTPDDVIAADFNHDGYSDLAILNSYFEAIDILLGAGDGTFGQIAPEPTIADPLSLAFGDIDNDGLSDLIAVSKDALGLHVMNENGAPEPMTTIVASSSGERVAVADVNHDSRTDIIYVETSFTSSASIVYGAGGGMFESPTTTNFFDGEFTRYAVQTADMTNDGLIDLVVFNESSITVAPNFCGS